MADGSQRFPDGANTVNSSTNHFKEFIQSDPQAKHLRDNYEESRLSGSSPGRDIQAILNLRKQRLDAADALLEQTHDYRRYRMQVNQIRADSRQAMEALHLSSIQNSGDKAIVSSWYATYNDPAAIDPVTGGINSDGLESVQEQWKIAHPGEFERLIEPNESIGETPQETTLRKDRKAISDAGWWDTDINAWDYLKQAIGARAKGELKIDSYKTYADYVVGRREQYRQQFEAKGRPSPDLLADIAMQRDPIVAAFNKIRTRERLLLQKNNPGLTALLNKWGYNHTSIQEYQLAVAQARLGGGASQTVSQ
jgi:hypothetical protein